MSYKTKMLLAAALVLLASYGTYRFLAQNDPFPPLEVQVSPTPTK